MTKDDALKLALESLERIDLWLKARYSGIGLVGVELDAIAAIKEALALTSTKCEVQPAQEPVAWMVKGELYKTQQFHLEGGAYANQIPLYATPPQREWVGLTDEEIDTTWKKWIGTERANKSYTLAIEDTLRSKNT